MTFTMGARISTMHLNQQNASCCTFIHFDGLAQFMTETFPGHPLLDTSAKLKDQLESWDDYPSLSEFIETCPPGAFEDWRQTALFLTRHTATAGTYSQFRGEVQRFLMFMWLIQCRTLKSVTGDDIDDYMAFTKKPPALWCGVDGRGKQRGFITVGNRRIGNPLWRPFAQAGTKKKAATLDVAVASLSIFFKKLVMTGYISRSPMIEATKRSQKADTNRGKGQLQKPTQPTAPRFTDWQWSFLKESLELAATENPDFERNLFVVVTMKALYLRVFELASHQEDDDIVERTMGDFRTVVVDGSRYWTLYIYGKGSKERWIPLPSAYLPYLKRYRRYRGLPPLPVAGETAPMVTKKGQEMGVGKRTVERIVEESIIIAADKMHEDGYVEEALELRQVVNKTHYLRHTGASMDIDAGRPLRDVSEDLGHESVAFTEQVYIQADTSRRFESGKLRAI